MVTMLAVLICSSLMALAQVSGLVSISPLVPQGDFIMSRWRELLPNVSCVSDAVYSSDAGTQAALPDGIVANASTQQQLNKPEEWKRNYIDVDWRCLEDYHFQEVLGEGTYAVVSRVIDRQDKRSYVAKVLKPIEFYRVEREITIIQDLAGGPNMIQLVALAENSTDGSIGIITEYVNSTSPRDLYPVLDDYWVRFYMFQLLRAIEYTHSKSIFHRDIKPDNIIIDHAIGKLRLIDWGMADYYDRAYSYSTSVASQYWRAPEQLVGYRYYDLSSDMWSFGAILAALVFYSEPFFYGRHNERNQVIEIAKVLGTEDLFKWIDKYNIELNEDFDNVVGWYHKKGLESFVPWKGQRDRIDGDALDLLNRILLFDHWKRLTASEALKHPYFDPVREDAMYHDEAYAY